jgi:hypothetical protein
MGNPGKGAPSFHGAKANYCGAGGCACNNGLDDDGDGLIDAADPECVGAMDNDESSFATGMPGDNRDPKWQDCFFDGNSGAGDDRLRDHPVLPRSLRCVHTEELRLLRLLHRAVGLGARERAPHSDLCRTEAR